MNELHTETIHCITLPTPYLVGDVHVYLIKGRQHILIDTGPNTEASIHILQTELIKAGSAVQKIDVLILTHHHPDHIGAAYLFHETAIVAGHPKLRPWIEKDAAHFQNIYTFFKKLYEENGMTQTLRAQIEKQHEAYISHTTQSKLHKEIREGVIEELPGWRILETPGHAQTHISLLQEKENLLIGGDHLISHISSNAIVEAPYYEDEDRPKTLLQYRSSLQKCTTVKTVYAGHGDVIHAPQQLIKKRLEQQVSKADMFLRKMEHNKITVFDLSKIVYPEMHLRQPDLTFSEVIGHLDLLEEEQRVTKEKINGLVYYQQI